MLSRGAQEQTLAEAAEAAVNLDAAERACSSAILRAYDSGNTQRAIAKATGRSKSAIGRIIDKRRLSRE